MKTFGHKRDDPGPSECRSSGQNQGGSEPRRSAGDIQDHTVTLGHRGSPHPILPQLLVNWLIWMQSGIWWEKHQFGGGQRTKGHGSQIGEEGTLAHNLEASLDREVCGSLR